MAVAGLCNAIGVGVALGFGVDIGPMSMFGAGGAITRTVTWSLTGSPVEESNVTVFVHVPGALARNVTFRVPLSPGLSKPIVWVKPEGVKHPPLTTSVS